MDPTKLSNEERELARHALGIESATARGGWRAAFRNYYCDEPTPLLLAMEEAGLVVRYAKGQNVAPLWLMTRECALLALDRGKREKLGPGVTFPCAIEGTAEGGVAVRCQSKEGHEHTHQARYLDAAGNEHLWIW
jgi:hypothetical protein